MDFNVFENVKTGLMIAIVLETVIIVGWSIRPDKIHKIYLIIGPLLAGAFWGLDAMVETNTEQLNRITKTVIQAAEEEDAETIIPYISKDFLLTNGMGKAAVTGVIRWWLDKPFIETIFLRKFEVTHINETEGTAEFRILCIFDKDGMLGYAGARTLKWRFIYERDNPETEYKIINIILLDNDTGQDIDPFTFRP